MNNWLTSYTLLIIDGVYWPGMAAADTTHRPSGFDPQTDARAAADRPATAEGQR